MTVNRHSWGWGAVDATWAAFWGWAGTVSREAGFIPRVLAGMTPPSVATGSYVPVSTTGRAAAILSPHRSAQVLAQTTTVARLIQPDPARGVQTGTPIGRVDLSRAPARTQRSGTIPVAWSTRAKAPVAGTRGIDNARKTVKG